MSDSLLSIKDLRVRVEEKEILHGISFDIKPGETHVVMGPNGAGKSTLGNAIMGNPSYEVAGKSTLGNAIMGNPSYEVTGGEIFFDGRNLLDMAVNERAKSGIYMSFQNPLEVPGVTLGNFIKTALEQRTGEHVRIWDFRKKMLQAMSVLQMDPSYAERDLNVGFSGGEKKKAEILQLMLLSPSLAILDETDSGLDVDAVRTVSEGIRAFQKNQDSALIIITHNAAILNSLHVDATHILVGGKLVRSGDASLVDEISEHGFTAYETLS